MWGEKWKQGSSELLVCVGGVASHLFQEWSMSKILNYAQLTAELTLTLLMLC